MTTAKLSIIIFSEFDRNVDEVRSLEDEVSKLKVLLPGHGGYLGGSTF